MHIYNSNNFVYSKRYRLWRHMAFWTAHVFFFSLLWYNTNIRDYAQNLFTTALWIPVRMLYCYPLIYWVLPKYLLTEKYRRFGFIVLLWALAGWFVNYLFRAYFFIPFQQQLQFKNFNTDPWNSFSLLASLVVSGAACIIVLFRHGMQKQQQLLRVEKEKVTAELQLLKAQVHPHFLFNTLNNIYSFSLEASPKTPSLILKLSTLLNYVLYDCKSDQVLLEKEISTMKDYIDLEKVRYGNKLDISVNIQGDIKDKYIAPLLLLPFLENAFKHGTSEQLEKPWLSMDLSVKQNILRCKILNSKNESVTLSENGIGINNVKRRLALLYADRHELTTDIEPDFFVVSLIIKLRNIPDQNNVRAVATLKAF
jgi:two-component system, LytTR family, sensor histidine kinase AlgZ